MVRPIRCRFVQGYIWSGGARPGRSSRVEKKPPTLGKKPPQGAIALLEGKNLPEMVRANGSSGIWET